MSRQLLTTIKMFINTGTGWSSKGDNDEKKRTNIVATAFLIFIAIPLALAFGFLSFYTAFLLYGSGKEVYVLDLGIAIAGLTMFFFGVLMIPGVFYFAEDIEHLLPLPVKPISIINAKFFTTYLWENITAIFVFLPVMIGYALGTNTEWYYWVYGLFILCTISLIPMLYGVILNIILIRFTSFGKNKNILSYVTSVMSIVLSTVIAVYLLNSMFSGEGDIFITFALSIESLSMMFAKYLPFITYATDAMTTGSFMSFLYYILMNLIVFAIYYILAKLFYFDGLLKMTSGNKSGKPVKNEDIVKKSRKQNKLVALVKKEFINLFINPSYFSACVASNIIIPLLFLFIPHTSMWNSVLNYLDSGIHEVTYEKHMLLFIVGIALFSFGMNYIASTAISREGSDYQAMKYLPVEYKTHLLAKMITALIISGITFIITVAIFLYYIRISIKTIVLGIIIGILISILVTELSIWLDLYNPTLNWEDEQKAVKQNFNGMIGLLMSLFLVFIVWLMIFKLNLEFNTLMLVIIITLLAFDYLVWDYLLEYIDGYFEKM